jgi:hypothetical protein
MAEDKGILRGQMDSVVLNHGLPLLSRVPERFTRRCGLAPSVDHLRDLSPVGNVSNALRMMRLPVLLPERSMHHWGSTCAFGGSLKQVLFGKLSPNDFSLTQASF